MSQPDKIYYNLSLICKKNNQTDPDVQARFQEGRQTAILNDASNYTFSIIKFTLNSNNLPILIPKIQTGQTDVNLTTYGMTMSIDDSGVVASTTPYFMEYDCRNKYFNNTISPPTVSQQDDPYYYMLSISHFVDMFNNTLSACYDDIKTQVPSLSGNAPQLIYNNNNLFSLYCDASDFAPANQFNIYLNDDLYNLLRNFNFTNVSNNGFNHQLIIKQRVNNLQTIDNVNYIVETQFYPSLQNWTPVQSIIFQSNLLGVNPEKVSAPIQLSSNSTTFFNQNTNNTEDILTDITLPVDNPCDYNSMVVYVANVFREADIVQNTIQKIDMIVGWKNKLNGIIYPIMLSDMDEITCKIKFERKNN